MDKDEIENYNYNYQTEHRGPVMGKVELTSNTAQRLDDLETRVAHLEFREDVAKAVAAERERCAALLDKLQERVGGFHNYYGYAAKVVRGDI